MASTPQTVQSILLENLYADPRNANVCSAEMLEKLETNIRETGLCPVLQVRPHPETAGAYILIDGHHRLQVLQKLGWTQIECQVWDLNETEASRFLLTLNRLRGVDNPRKRAVLIESLLPTFEIETLSTFLPESPDELKGLLALLEQNDIQIQQAFQAQLEAERKTLPIPLGFMIPAADFPVVQAALKQYQTQTQGDQSAALIAICQAVTSQQCSNEMEG